MDTEAAADQYREAVTRQRRPCAHLVCKDTGSIIRAGGSTIIGRGATAPRSIHELGLCLAAPPMHITGTYRRGKSVLTTLASMEQLLQLLSDAQVMFLHGKRSLLCYFASCKVVLQRRFQHLVSSLLMQQQHYKLPGWLCSDDRFKWLVAFWSAHGKACIVKHMQIDHVLCHRLLGLTLRAGWIQPLLS